MCLGMAVDSVASEERMFHNNDVILTTEHRNSICMIKNQNDIIWTQSNVTYALCA